jgi:ACS family hexuronate transporter-like MFS transporter
MPHKRWIVAGLLLAVTMINYTDRMTLGVLVGEVRRDLVLNETDYAHIVSIFMFAYAVMYAGSGYVVDRLGARRGLAVFVFGWSISQMLHGLAHGKWSLATYRFLLGITEPGNFPAATKAIREWFPVEQRAIGVGIFNAGSSLGAAVASPVAAFVALRFGWRAAFVFTGSIGLAWLALWLLIYRSPAAEGSGAREDGAATKEPEAAPRVDWRRVLASRRCLVVMLARFFSDPVIYFVIFWLPSYLQKERGFDLAMVGKYGWVPYVFGDFGYILGGWLSGRLMRAGKPLGTARKLAMTVGAALLPAAIFAPMVPSAAMAIAATSFVVFGHAIWIANLLTLPADLFPSHEVGTAAGLSGMAGSIGGVLANLGTGWVVTNFTYTPIFLLAGAMHPLSIFLVWKLLPNREFPAMQKA